MASRPSRGPRPSQGSSDASRCRCDREVNSSMLMMEIANPMLLVSVNTLPTA